MADAGLIVLTAFISPFRAERDMVRKMLPRRRVHRDIRRYAAGRGREARRQGPLRQGARRRAQEFHRHRQPLRGAGRRRDPHRHDDDERRGGGGPDRRGAAEAALSDRCRDSLQPNRWLPTSCSYACDEEIAVVAARALLPASKRGVGARQATTFACASARERELRPPPIPGADTDKVGRPGSTQHSRTAPIRSSSRRPTTVRALPSSSSQRLFIRTRGQHRRPAARISDVGAPVGRVAGDGRSGRVCAATGSAILPHSRPRFCKGIGGHKGRASAAWRRIASGETATATCSRSGRGSLHRRRALRARLFRGDSRRLAGLGLANLSPERRHLWGRSRQRHVRPARLPLGPVRLWRATNGWSGCGEVADRAAVRLARPAVRRNRR